VMEGKLEEIFDALTAYFQTEKLKHEGGPGGVAAD